MQSENIGSIQCTTHNALQYLKCMFITFCAPVYCWNITPSNIGSSSCSSQNHFSLTPLSLCVLFIVRDFVRYKFYFFSRENKTFFSFFSTNAAAAVAFRCIKKTLILSIVWCAICEWGKIMNNEIKAENFFFPSRSLVANWKMKTIFAHISILAAHFSFIRAVMSHRAAATGTRHNYWVVSVLTSQPYTFWMAFCNKHQIHDILGDFSKNLKSMTYSINYLNKLFEKFSSMSWFLSNSQLMQKAIPFISTFTNQCGFFLCVCW